MKTKQLPLDKLIPYAGNPRKNDHAVEQVAAAIKRFGFRVPVLAKSDGSLIDGHLRVKAAKHLGMEEVPVVLCDDLSEADIKALRISINRMAELADWDSELLSAELEGLAEQGIGLEDVGFSKDDLSELLKDAGESLPGEEAYTRKIEAPTYTPSETKPVVAELFNAEKTERIIADIEGSKLSADEKAFLIAAAHRHTVFDFGKIADFYAHSQPEVQRLMEDSALVIIDFDKAIEQGYVRLSENIRKTYMQDNGDEE
ncbi:MAG: ParB N-terminal domain-containing protein [Synechococcus sp.]|nr:ParB N-terminal domain-containing protein [Synechococcus sp.]